MRGLILATGLGLLLAGQANANPANPFEYAPEARAYLTLDFGGAAQRNALRYGLRLDHDARFLETPLPAILELNFAAHGFDAARLNGLDLVRRIGPLKQVDFETLESEAPEPEAADDGYEESSSSGDVEYTFIDWGVLAIGVVGLGFVAVEVFDTEETPDTPPPAAEEEGCLLDPLPSPPLPCL